MPLQPFVAHYRITAKIGQGGMGEVWRATDTKLGREVAVKVLPEVFLADVDRMFRFTREAQVLAALNHPNIAAIYGVEERALILELVPGPTLAERIGEGPVALDEALPIARQIAEALEYAHESGIVHRDLKPANIKLTTDGRVKLLDFGLAKAMSTETAAANPASSPTLTMHATEAGVILGTVAYMSPEQARGKVVDKRADIWAFGVVLYEMVTGRMLFMRETASDTLAAVLTKEPDWEAVPAALRKLLRSCLDKDPKRRLRDIGDAWRLIEDAVVTPRPDRAQGRLGILSYRIAAGVLAVMAVVLSILLWRAMRPLERPLTRLSVDLGLEPFTNSRSGFPSVAISPDGQRLVFPARGPDGKGRLATRLLDQPVANLLPGTEDGTEPFFSPDGHWIGFFADAQLKKIPVQGGAPMALAKTLYGTPLASSWGDDGQIIVGQSGIGPLWSIPAAGGALQLLPKLGSREAVHAWPQVLPGGEVVLLTASPQAFSWGDANIEAASLKTGKVKIVQSNGFHGRYLPTGHLVYVHQKILLGVRFDLAKLQVLGAPVPILDDMGPGGRFDYSSTGTFVYVAGKSPTQAWNVAWLYDSGKLEPLTSTPGIYGDVRVSPDGRNLAFEKSQDIYIHHLERDTTTRLTFKGRAATPIWMPDGRHIVFKYAGNSFLWTRTDGVGDPQRLLESPHSMVPWSVSPDGRWLAYHEKNPETGYDIGILPLDLTDPDHPKPGTPELLLRTSAEEAGPRFSPDGRWIAYASNESGHYETYVRPFPAVSGSKWQISNGGGTLPIWLQTGRQLFYESLDDRIMVVDYTVDGSSFAPGKPRLWSEKQLFHLGASSNLDLAPDGKRFVVFTPSEAAPGEKGSMHVTIMQNFFDELKRKAP
jgi:serine/threonine-protein kinase